MVIKNRNFENQIIVDTVVDSMKSKKAKEIVVMDFGRMRQMVCDYFIICQASNAPQAEAIADSILYNLRHTPGLQPIGIEGRQNAEWILLDYGSVVVHIFQEKARQFYRIEDLWADAEFTRIAEAG